MKLKRILSLFGLSTFLLASISSSYAQDNIALGRKITTSKPSNYALTKDKNPAQLVDGKYAGESYDASHKTRSLWVQEGAMTWAERKDPVIFTIDLGEVKSISGISYSTAAGVADVQFPSFGGIAVSEDNKEWYYQGDLIGLSRKNEMPELGKYSKHRFSTQGLMTKGRYIALAIMQFPYTVTDEIEVYAGDDAWLSSPAGGLKISSPDEMEELAAAAVSTSFMQRRIAADIRDIEEVLRRSSLSSAQKSTFSAQLDSARVANEEVAPVEGSIKTILPINEIHRNVMATYGAILAAEKVAPVTVWKKHRYAWLPLLLKPQTSEAPEVSISMLGNQFRSDSLLITNASDSPKTVQLEIKDPPKGAREGWLQVLQAVWMDTYQGTPVTDGLLPITDNKVTIPAGFTQPIWFIVDSSKVPAGNYKSTFTVNGENVPFHLSISSVKMGRPRLSLTAWDYTDPQSMRSGASRGITAKNFAGARTLMRSHFLDSPWATRNILPYPQAEDFDAQNNLKTVLDFTALDEWITGWPDARRYLVFVSATENTTFGGAKRGTAEFDARMGSWARVLSERMKKLGKDPSQLALLIVDEPGLRGQWQDDVTAEWGKAIKAAAPEITLFSDPVWSDPTAENHREMAKYMDILTPNTQKYFGSYEKPARDFFEKQRLDGKNLWLYACIGPTRLFNPQQYFRGQAWRVFSMGGNGMGFWAFGDSGGQPTSWNDYQISQSFTLAIIDEDTVHNSINWESVREGVQDFEELAMLRDAIAQSSDAAFKTAAQKVLSDAIAAVLDTRTNDRWYNEKNPEYTDVQLQKVREMLRVSL